MKTHIEPSQLAELSDIGKERLRSWWTPQTGDLVHSLELDNTHFFSFHSIFDYYKNEYLPLLTTKQLIELLGENWPLEISRDKVMYGLTRPDEFCDVLWQAAKAALEG